MCLMWIFSKPLIKYLKLLIHSDVAIDILLTTNIDILLIL